MKEIDKIASALFEKIRSRFENVTVGDEEAKATQNPELARFFNFDYVSLDGQNFGNITISIIDNKSLKLYFSKNISGDLDDEHRKEWYDFLRNMRMFAKRNLLNFDTRDINRGGLDIKDLKSISQSDDSLDPNEVQMQESKLYGTTRSSYQMIGDCKMIVRHTGPIDEQVHGARARNINGIYLETSQGERFKCPVNSLTCGRALARHVSNGGNLMDDIAKHIVGMVQEMSDMRVFVRGMRNRTFEDVETTGMVEAAIERYSDLNRSLYKLSSQRNYRAFAESFTPPPLVEEDDTDVNALKEKFVKKVFDDRMLTALPYVKKAYESRQAKISEQVSYVKEFIKSNSALKLTANESIDELMGMMTFENNNQIVVKVLENIALRADNAQLAEFAKRWASKYETLGETIDETIKEEKALAIQLATRYLKDLNSIKENKAYAEQVRVAAPAVNAQQQFIDPALNEFAEWTTSIGEVASNLPQSKEDQKKLQDLLSQPLQLGPDASNAIGALGDLIDDEELFSMLGQLFDAHGAEYDCAPDVQAWCQEHLPFMQFQQQPTQKPELGKQPESPASPAIAEMKRLAGLK